MRVALLLLFYPLLVGAVESGAGWKQRFVTWGTASFIGLIVLIVLATELPPNLAVLGLSQHVSRLLCAYLAGLGATAAIVVVTGRLNGGR